MERFGPKETEAVWFDLRNEHGASEFVGYQSTFAEGQILAIVKDGKPIAKEKGRRDCPDAQSNTILRWQWPGRRYGFGVQ